MAINMDAVLELSAKVDGMSQLLQLEKSLSDVKGELNKYDQANKSAGISTEQMGLMMTAASFAGNLLADAAQNVLANLGNMVTTTIQSGLAFEQTETRIRMLSEGYGEFDAVQSLITKNAALLGQSQVQAASGFADIYARLRPLGIGLEDVNAVYLGFNSLAMQSGTTAEAASGAFMQLSQALGSGTLRGDEFNSVAEQVPGILMAVADVMGEPVGALRGLAAEGKITSDVVIQAMRNAAADGGSALEALSGSAGMSVTRMQTAFTDLQAQLGRQLVPAVAEVARVATELAEGATGLLVPALQKAGQEAQLLAFYFDNIREYNGLFEELGFSIAGLGGAMSNSALSLKSAGDETKAWWGNLINVEGVLNTIAAVLPPMVGTTLQLFNNKLVQEFALGIDALTGRHQARLDVMNEEAENWNLQIAKTSEAKAKAEELLEAQQKQSEELRKQTQAKERFKEQSEEIVTLYALAEDELKKQTAVMDTQDQQISDAISMEKSRNDLLEYQLEQRLESADSLKEEEQILLDLRNVAIRNAELEYESTKAAIDQQLFQSELQQSELEIKYQQALATLSVAEAEGQVTEAHRRSVEQMENALELAGMQVQRTYDHADALIANAEIQLRISRETAQSAYEQSVAEAQTKYTNEAAAELAATAATVVENTKDFNTELEKAITHTIKVGDELREVSLAIIDINTGMITQQQDRLLNASAAYEYEKFTREEAEKILDLYGEQTAASEELADAMLATASIEVQRAVAAERNLAVQQEITDELRKQSAEMSSVMDREDFLQAQRDSLAAIGLSPEEIDKVVPKFATGGYVTSPTLAMVGEGGEPEYVIPQSKMLNAIMAFLGGERGADILSQGGTIDPNVVMLMAQDYLSKTQIAFGASRRNMRSGPLADTEELRRKVSGYLGFTPGGTLTMPPVSVNINVGSTVSMNNQQYVTVAQLNNAVNQAVSDTITILTGNVGVQQMVGI